MRAFTCDSCDSRLYFENSVCVACGAALGFSREQRDIVALAEDGTWTDADGHLWRVCVNLNLSGCTWLAPDGTPACSSCELTRTRPADDDAVGLGLLPAAEAAKRHLLVELDTQGLRYTPRTQDPEHGLCFDLLSSVGQDVVIGHDDGVITIDLAEGDDAHRAKVQAELAEPYRTMLGHLRHEVGHHLEQVLVTGDRIAAARALFGDERIDYQAQIDRHYAEGPPPGWEESYISSYATMHPFEDFAETFAHLMHIADTVETAAAYGLVTVDPAAFSRFRDLVAGVWLPLSTALNQINRSMGKVDLYPFIIPDPVLDKLDFVADLRG